MKNSKTINAVKSILTNLGIVIHSEEVDGGLARITFATFDGDNSRFWCYFGQPEPSDELSEPLKPFGVRYSTKNEKMLTLIFDI